tara:strand:- start:5107 stop:5829 length:723 start_codon:yes stop_codon:yes gene_type:complete
MKDKQQTLRLQPVDLGSYQKKPKKPRDGSKEEITIWMSRYFLSMNPDIDRLRKVTDAVVVFLNHNSTWENGKKVVTINETLKMIRYWADPYGIFVGDRNHPSGVFTADRVKLVYYWMVKCKLLDWCDSKHDHHFNYVKGANGRIQFYKRHLPNIYTKKRDRFLKNEVKWRMKASAVNKLLWVDNDPNDYYWGAPSHESQELTPKPTSEKSTYLLKGPYETFADETWRAITHIAGISREDK